jgi:hypothetical protein
MKADDLLDRHRHIIIIIIIIIIGSTAYYRP